MTFTEVRNEAVRILNGGGHMGLGHLNVVKDADSNCKEHGCCLSAVRSVKSIGDKLDACEQPATKPEYSEGGACSPTRGQGYSDTTPKSFTRPGSQPFAEQREKARQVGIYPGDVPLYWVVPAEVMARINKLEEHVQGLDELAKYQAAKLQEQAARIGATRTSFDNMKERERAREDMINKMGSRIVELNAQTAKTASRESLYRAALTAVGVDPDRIA